jgi:hypothetical protein
VEQQDEDEKYAGDKVIRNRKMEDKLKESKES